MSYRPSKGYGTKIRLARPDRLVLIGKMASFRERGDFESSDYIRAFLEAHGLKTTNKGRKSKND